jgi:type I restriction enzyme S subunit
MKHVPLSSVAQVNPGAPEVAQLRPDQLVDFVPMTAVSETGIMTVSNQRPFAEVAKGFTSFRQDDVLLAKITPCFENNKIALAQVKTGYGFGSTEFHVIRCVPNLLSPKYLLHFLRQNRLRLAGERRMTGSAGQRRVPKAFLEELEIPLPPLAEQKCIAAILDQADKTRRERRDTIALLSKLGSSIFRAMFHEADRFPETRMDEICSVVTDGTHFTPTYADEGVIFLSAKNVTSGFVNWEDVRFIPHRLHLELTKRVSPKIGDVLLAKNGTTGVAAVVDRDIVFDIYVSLALLRPSIRVLSQYLLYAVNSPECQKQFRTALKGIGVPNLHLVDIRRARIPLPPIDSQKRFAARIAKIEHLRSLQERHLQELDELFLSLQHRSFRGELISRQAEQELKMTG